MQVDTNGCPLLPRLPLFRGPSCPLRHRFIVLAIMRDSEAGSTWMGIRRLCPFFPSPPRLGAIGLRFPTRAKESGVVNTVRALAWRVGRLGQSWMSETGRDRDKRSLRRQGDFRRQPRSCRAHTSQQNCWITSPTSCKIQETHSRVAASSVNPGSRVPESTSSPMSPSTPPRSYNCGKTPFQIYPPPLRVTPDPCPLVTQRWVLQPLTRKMAVGSRPFLALST